MKFILKKFPNGSFGLETKEPMTYREATHLAKKLNEVLA